jgi:hypothetical protein
MTTPCVTSLDRSITPEESTRGGTNRGSNRSNRTPRNNRNHDRHDRHDRPGRHRDAVNAFRRQREENGINDDGARDDDRGNSDRNGNNNSRNPPLNLPIASRRTAASTQNRTHRKSKNANNKEKKVKTMRQAARKGVKLLC